MEKLIQKLIKEGGVIVNSSSLTPLEIAQAQSCDRFFVDENSLGFALMTEDFKCIKEAYKFLQDIDIILDYAISDKEKIAKIESAMYNQTTPQGGGTK